MASKRRNEENETMDELVCRIEYEEKELKQYSANIENDTSNIHGIVIHFHSPNSVHSAFHAVNLLHEDNKLISAVICQGVKNLIKHKKKVLARKCPKYVEAAE